MFNLALVDQLVGNIPDPEIPVVTLRDLGILKSVEVEEGRLVVRITPTYSGCPAIEAIQSEVRKVLNEEGWSSAQVRLELAPAWTTDWITTEGRRKLKAYGIAPPSHCADVGNSVLSQENVLQFNAPLKGIRCPLCESANTEQLSRFGSTPCKALYRCKACGEPFDYFKPY